MGKNDQPFGPLIYENSLDVIIDPDSIVETMTHWRMLSERVERLTTVSKGGEIVEERHDFFNPVTREWAPFVKLRRE